MKSSLKLFFCSLFALLIMGANPLESLSREFIADSYPRKINIDHNFKGINILLYGAKNEYGNVVIVVRGPKRDLVLRQKGKVAGIWTNTKNIALDDFYSFYSIASTMPLEDIENNNLLKKLRIGTDNIDIKAIDELESTNDAVEYKGAAIKLMEDSGLFRLQDNDLSFWGETLFRTFIEFPKNIVRGEYSIDLYLFNDGLLKSFQTMPIIVEQVGFEAFIYNLAHEKSLLYGLLCVFIAIFFGWSTGVIFGKR